MKVILNSKFIVILLSVLCSLNIMASDFAKEKRWADQIVDDLMVGEAEWLNLGSKKFLGIYTPNSTKKSLGGVIVLHGIGIHPNWADVVQPIRSDLPDLGWHTIAIQMPILKNEAKSEDYVPHFNGINPRLEAAIAFLKSKGVKNIIIVGHSLGSTMGAYFMASNKDTSVKAFVAISVSATSKKAPWYLSTLPKIKSPVLEIYGSDDLPEVMSSITDNASLAKSSGVKDYRQIKVDEADHFFKGKNDELVKQIAGWIKTYAEK